MKQKSTLAQNLIAKRKEHGLTQSETAERLEVKHKRYAAWEESRAVPSHHFMLMLAAIYGTTVDDLLKAKKDDNGSTDQAVQE